MISSADDATVQEDDRGNVLLTLTHGNDRTTMTMAHTDASYAAIALAAYLDLKVRP